MVEKLAVKKVRGNRVKKTNTKEKSECNEKGEEEVVPHVPKKRGRKPKGGKIVKKEINLEEVNDDNQVAILHLKCKLNDLNDSLFTNINSQIDYNPNIIKEVEAYSKDKTDNYFNLIDTNNDNKDVIYNVIEDPVNSTKCSKLIDETNNDAQDIFKDKHKNKKNIYNKLKDLELLFNNNNNVNKKSDCFWCTCGFTTPPIHIPSLFHKEKYEVYGCFCSPECAAAFLFTENIDNNTKFERYQLLNYIYGKVYNYEKEIKFAPNPYYTLDKYYGNLTIQEYRQLLEYDRLILVIDKPVSKIYPEIHEDNNDFETVYENKLSLKKGIKTDKNDVLNNVFSVSNSG